MSLIGIEISDAGIIAAAGEPGKLLVLDGQDVESPGFALPQKKGLLVGKEAEAKAHLFPRQILNRFWDQLNTEPPAHSEKYTPQSNAEIVYSHLARIRQAIQPHGDEFVLTVPGFYDRRQLGIILSIAQELSMDVKGFVPQALVASTAVRPGRMLCYLDIHLHRTEVIYLKQGEYLTVDDSAVSGEKGLLYLYREWVEAIARQFVRSTRFDPIHQAVSEQRLYDRLPEVLSHLRHNPAMVFDIIEADASYSTTLERDLFTRKAESVYRQIGRLVEEMREKHDPNAAVTLQLSYRLARLPGCKEMLSGLQNAQIIELDRGAAARGLLGIWQELAAQRGSEGASLFTSRPWLPAGQARGRILRSEKPADKLPTHLLYRDIAYPLTEKPLVIGEPSDAETNGLRISGDTAEVSARHFTVGLRGRQAMLDDYSTQGTFVDGARVHGSTTLKLGQIIRLGNSGEKLRLIACLSENET